MDIIVQKKWVPDVLIFQYVFSDMYKHSDEKQIVQFIDKLASFLNSYNQEPIYILCNDINLSKSMGGGREFFDLLESKIQTPKIVRRMHFNNVNKERHYEYGGQYDSSELVFNMISDEIRNAYNPFESCASAQMLIKKKERSYEMILSVSRRTDIPNYYSEWFYNRIKEGFLYVRNPMNAHQISEIKITPDVVDCIVFWTKNPLPMIKRLDEIKEYNYYFQFTLTGYGNDVEVNLPNKKTKMIPVFQELSKKIGKQKVIWRYDPIFFSDRYTEEYHLKAFKSIAEALSGYTEKCVISFVDIYPKNKKNMDGLSSHELNDDELREFAEKLSKIAADNNIKIGSCAEKIDLDECGIVHNCCIDRELIEKIIGFKLKVGKDKNQRIECGCVESVEIGTYNTCKNGCVYCYANYSSKSVETNAAKYDPSSPLLCGQVQEDDKITIRKVESLKDTQLSIFDM